MKITVIAATLAAVGLLGGIIAATYWLFFKAADRAIDKKFEEKK